MNIPEKNTHTYEPMTADEFNPYIGVMLITLNGIMNTLTTPSQRAECTKWAKILGTMAAENLEDGYNDQIKHAPKVSPMEFLLYSMIASRINNA